MNYEGRLERTEQFPLKLSLTLLVPARDNVEFKIIIDERRRVSSSDFFPALFFPGSQFVEGGEGVGDQGGKGLKAACPGFISKPRSEATTKFQSPDRTLEQLIIVRPSSPN